MSVFEPINTSRVMIPHISAKDSPPVGERLPSDEEVEAVLKQKIVILEDFIEYDGRLPPAIEERCEVLRYKVQSLEDHIFKAGKSAAAIEYLRCAPESYFQKVAPHDFQRWLDVKLPLSHAQGGNAARFKSPRKRKFLYSDDGFHVFSASSENSPDPSNARTKRLRTNESEKHPCLRCRILKKKCDFLEQCRHCPSQGFDNETDYWKVLGCFRGHLRDFSAIFCPAFSRSTQRTLLYRSGGTEIINFALTKSRVSDQKRRRMIHLVRTRNDFARLSESSWEDTARRESLSLSGSSFIEHDGNAEIPTLHLADYEAPWAVLQVVSMDTAYMSKTAFNLFSLIRLGNDFSKSEPASWELFNLAKRLLRQSTELYLLERLCTQIASGDMLGKVPFDPTRSTPNTLVLVDLKEDVETFLRSFEKACSGRAKLDGTAQLACFYALLVFGVVKSMLTDAYSIRASYEDPNPWSEEEATKISSAYKALVSVFCWSSKADIVVQDVMTLKYEEYHSQVMQTRKMVRSNEWESFGVKGTKEFLLGLGACFLPDSVYNGFFAQKFGLKELPTICMKATATREKEHQAPRREIHPFESVEQTATSPNQEASQASVSTLDGTLGPFSIFERMSSSKSPRAFGQVASPSASSPRTLYKNKTPESSKSNNSTASSPTTFTFVTNDANDTHAPARTHGGRKGALPPATLKKSREVRKVGACWNCWVMKMPCSEGSTCQRCQKKGTKPYPRCNRAPFDSYTDILFPEWIISDFTPEAISSYISTNTRGFTSQTIDVDVTSWADASSITLSVNYFVPIPEGSSQQTYHDRHGQPLGVESLPVGILDLDCGKLGDEALRKIDDIIQNPLFPEQILGHNSSNMTSMVFDILYSFYHAMPAKNKLIHDCFKLVATIRSVNRPVIFTPSSATRILSHLQIESPADQLYSSRILNRQTKALSYHISRLMMTRVLSQLEKTMRSRDKSFWPICFAAMLLLTYCMEQMEVLAGAHVQAARLGDQEARAAVEKEPREYCAMVDVGPFAQLSHLFHALYRTGRADSGGLNPLREDFESRDIAGFDDAATNMIRTMREKTMKNVEMLKEQNKPFDSAAGQEELAKNSSGRLMARFLRSFV
ncbi:hypothetical protein ONS95_008913 [Cadophora gregata]|uniref:uncharacterized protein n=1 Tax=Cadophora gregata TaxID=51156 RepID=UPI0026DC8092|nr:uncharacterized protein ONS95_008913 [Cadophora gregata]KAK0123923.1 hypothetical protein ONS95_008913 [Cadophora gregata]